MTKLEEIARAICATVEGHPERKVSRPYAIGGGVQPAYLRYFPAAVTVVSGPLSEPNEAMIAPVLLDLVDRGVSPELVWQAMCDAILKEDDTR